MTHGLHRLFRTARRISHPAKSLNHVMKPFSQAMPRGWIRNGTVHKHTPTFWVKVAQRGFKLFWGKQ
jgi:hypothetical protein